MEKINIEILKQNVENLGYIILNEDDFKNTSSYINIQDEYGYKYITKYSNLLCNKKPMTFSKYNIYSLYNINVYLKNNNADMELISDEFISANDKLDFRCKICGNIFKKSMVNVISTKYLCCYKCSCNNRGISRRIKMDKIIEDFNSVGLKLLDNKYEGNAKRMLCENELGYRGYVSYNHLYRFKNNNGNNSGIEYFSELTNKENIIHNVNNFCKLNNINTKIIGKSLFQNKSRTEYDFKCDCGNIFHTTISSFRYGKQYCDKCTNYISTYEKLVLNFLYDNNIAFERQKRFDNCRNKLPLPFDFYFKEKNIILEIDGEGHYRPCYFKNCSYDKAIESFNKTVYNDKIKNDFCKNNNIKLIRIPYWEFKNENYKNIILNNIINV